MQPYQQQFIALALANRALGFGEFTLKSGRESPYFFNAGQLCHGAALAQVGHCYAQAIMGSDIIFDLLLGPAYKGIPLATVTACALANYFDFDVPFTYNRKEAKAHGEGGILVGAAQTLHPGQDKTHKKRVLIIDDVMTAGTAVREVVPLIERAGGQVAGVVIGLDRQERGHSDCSATQEVAAAFAIPVISVVTLDHIVEYLRMQPGHESDLETMDAYRQHYGI